MQRKRQPERDDEPAVTFELEETPRTPRGGRAGAAAVAGAGLVSSAAASGAGDSLDVFDLAGDAEEQVGDVPVTSFRTLLEADVDPAFPPIDFTGAGEAVAAMDASAGAETLFGATAGVGGGFVLDAAAASGEAFGAAGSAVEPVSATLLEDGSQDDQLELDDETPDDLDLS